MKISVLPHCNIPRSVNFKTIFNQFYVKIMLLFKSAPIMSWNEINEKQNVWLQGHAKLPDSVIILFSIVFVPILQRMSTIESIKIEILCFLMFFKKFWYIYVLIPGLSLLTAIRPLSRNPPVVIWQYVLLAVLKKEGTSAKQTWTITV